MPVPIKPPCGLKSGCAATSTGSRITKWRAQPAGRPTMRPPDRTAINAPSYVIAAPEHDSEEEVTQWSPVVIAESTTALKRLSVSEAVMELDMRGTPVMVFRHAGHGRVNLVYRRADGHIGWIDLPPIEQDAH